MAFKNLIAFGAGEITPELSERGNLDKYRTGLKTLRNCLVTKMGGLRGRRGTVFSGISQVNKYVYHTLPNSPLMFAFTVGLHTPDEGNPYSILKYRVYYDYDNYSFKTTSLLEITAQEFNESDLDKLHFTNSEDNLYVFCKGKFVLTIPIKDTFTYQGYITLEYILFPDLGVTNPTFAMTVGSANSPSGYDVDYGYTVVKDGVESGIWGTDDTRKLPAGTAQYNTITVKLEDETNKDLAPDEIRFYRRPKDSGAWGFVGLGLPEVDGSDLKYAISDFGADADYANQPPQFVTGFMKQGTIPVGFITANNVRPKTGIIYQNRLIINDSVNENKAYGSRTDYYNKFSRDFPLQDDSAVAFKTGSNGGGNINRFHEGRGLALATNVGIYETPSDILKYDTAFAIKRSDVVHDEIVPILSADNGMIVTDKRIEGVFKLTPSGDSYDYKSTEISIFSAHLLEGRRIVSWDFQDDGGKILWIVRDDGVVLSLSYQEDQQLQSWARHDFKHGKAKQVLILKRPEKSDLVMFKVEYQVGLGLENSIEILSERDLDIENYIGTDHTIIFKNQMVPSDTSLTLTNDDGDEVFETGNITFNANIDRVCADTTEQFAIPADERYVGMIVEVTEFGPYWKQLVGGIENANWEDYTGIFSNTAGKGAVGSIMRFVNQETKDYADYEVTAFNGGFGVMPNIDIQLVSDRDLYDVMDVSGNSFTLTEIWQTFKTLTGLGSLEGRKVSVRLDGFTHASALNLDPDKAYHQYTVSGGQITLVNEYRGHNISVGVPIVQDIGTLAVDTVEQSPVKLESQLVNKIWLSYFKSRAFYAGSSFPEDDTVTNMIDHETQWVLEENGEIESSKPFEPYTRREEMIIEGDWSKHGEVCLRNVDPQPTGLRAIILDEELYRG